MKFRDSLKDVPVGDWVAGRLWNSGMFYSCDVCKTVTPWVDRTDRSHPGVHVCSDECLDALDERRAELAAEEATAPPIE